MVRGVLPSHGHGPGELLPILLDVQSKVGYLPEEGVRDIAQYLGTDVGEVYSVASFYSQFRLTPIGRYHIQVCRGTACHIRGAPKILGEMESQTGISEGETSEDMQYSLETVACMGCCALAPVIKVNSDVHGELTIAKTQKAILDLPAGETDGG